MQLINGQSPQRLISITTQQHRLSVGFNDAPFPIGDEHRVNAIVEQLTITLMRGLQPFKQLRVLDRRACQAPNTGHHQ